MDTLHNKYPLRQYWDSLTLNLINLDGLAKTIRNYAMAIQSRQNNVHDNKIYRYCTFCYLFYKRVLWTKIKKIVTKCEC